MLGLVITPSRTAMKVIIKWKNIGETSRLFGAMRCLYAYLSPSTRRILYIGKADRASVRKRYYARDKRKVWKRMPRRLLLLVGLSLVEDEVKFSWQLLHDIESLLIYEVKSFLNTMSKKSRISRPGMKVLCQGYWPVDRKAFMDGG
jgi:hypothetical protein